MNESKKNFKNNGTFIKRHRLNSVKQNERTMIHMFKKSMTLLLALSLLASGAAVYAADDTAADVNNLIAVRETVESDRMQVVAEVKEVGEDYIIVSLSTDGITQTDLQLNISEETVLIDSEQAAAFSLSDLKVGDSVFAVYSSIMTRSIPAQSAAALIATNTDKGGAVNLVKADSVETDSEGNLVITDNGQDLIVTMAKDALLRPYQTKNIVKLADVTAGSTLVLWYDAVTLSLPAQAAAEKGILVSTAETTVPEEMTAFEEAKSLGFLDGVEMNAGERITRAQFAEIACNMLNKVKPLPEADATKKFSDTDSEKIMRLAAAGIVNGKDDALFAPEDTLTLEETAVMAMRMADYAGATLPTVKSVGDASVAAWARPAVESLRVTGILAEDGNTGSANTALDTILNLYHHINSL